MKHALLLLALIATQARAQIIYTDVIPDHTYNLIGDTCHLDLDNDGQADFLLFRSEVSYHCFTCTSPTPEERIMIYGLAANVIAYEDDWGMQWPQALTSGQMIDATTGMSMTDHFIRQVQPSLVCGMNGCVPGPPVTWSLAWMNNPGPRYLGLRFTIAGATHYGWARLTTSSVYTFTLMDYAYNSVPDEGILTGDHGTSTGIASSALRGMQVTPNPFSSTLSISLQTGTTGSVSYRVLSLIGQALLTRTVASTSGPSAITLDLASLAPGTYLLEMQTGGERIVRKVAKE